MANGKYDIGAVFHYYNVKRWMANNATLRSGLERQRLYAGNVEGGGEDTIEDALRIVKRAFENLMADLESITIHLRPTDVSGRKAEQVFGVLELLEMILCHLDPTSLLDAQQMNKAADVKVRSSKKVQQCMSLKPQPGARFSSPYRDFNMAGNGEVPCISIRVRDTVCDVRFGSRAKSQLICQPPVFEVQASITCCDHTQSGQMRFESAKFSNSSGITVGDIVELAAKLQGEHLTCAKADRERHDDDGFVRSAVWFRAISPLQGDDPFFVNEQVERDREMAEELQDRQKEEKMDAYLRAKRFARAHRAKIPTMEEYEANPDEYDREECSCWMC